LIHTLRSLILKLSIISTTSNDSTAPTPQKNPQVIWDEVAEWNRLLDYEENAILRGIPEGRADRKKRLEEQKRSPMASLTETNLSPWGWKFYNHLKEFSARLYEELKANGSLYDHCQKVADQAGLEMSDLLQGGLPYNQGFELIRDQLHPQPEA